MSRPQFNSWYGTRGANVGNGIPKRARSLEERRAMIAARAPVVKRNRALFDAHWQWLKERAGW